MTLALAGMALAGMAQQKFVIKGHFDGVKSDSLLVLLYNEDFSGQERLDTVKMQNGNFEYSLPCDKMRMIVIGGKDGDMNSSFQHGYIQLPAIPGETAEVSGDMKKQTFKGTAFYTDMEAYNQQTAPVEEKMSQLQQEFVKRVKANENRDSVSNEIRPKYDALTKEIKDITKSFVKSHPSSQFSGYLLPQIDGDERAEYLAVVTDAVKNGSTAAYLAMTVKREEAAKKREEAAAKLQPGVAAPDFTLNDINGKPLALSSLKGKTVVLDFWGSWCGWCIKGIPEMKKYYDKYKAKGLEILGIDCNDTEAKWKDAVKKHALPWLHVRNEGKPDVTALYGISGFPTKIVVDKDGKIAKVVVGEDPEFYTYLDSLFK